MEEDELDLLKAGLTPLREGNVPFHGKQLHTVERIRKIEDGKALENLIKIEDPEYFKEPWFARITYAWRPDLRISEYSCEENNRNMPVNGRTVAQ